MSPRRTTLTTLLRLCWCALLALLPGLAQAATPIVLPRSEKAAVWEDSARMAGFVIVPSVQPGAVVVTAGPETWEIRVVDAAGKERRAKVPAPTTQGEREDLLWVAASLATPLETGVLSAPALQVPEPPPPVERPRPVAQAVPEPEPPPEPEPEPPPPPLPEPDTSPWGAPPASLPPPATAAREALVAAEPLPRAAPYPPPAPAVVPPPPAEPIVKPLLGVRGSVVSTSSLLATAASPQLSLRLTAFAGVRLLEQATLAAEATMSTAVPVSLWDQTALLSRRGVGGMALWSSGGAWQPGVGIRFSAINLKLVEGTAEGTVHTLWLPSAGMRLTLEHDLSSSLGVGLGGGLDADLGRALIEQSATELPLELPMVRGVVDVTFFWMP